MAESRADFESHGLWQLLTQNRADYTVLTRRSGREWADKPGEGGRPKAFPVGTASTGGCRRWICYEKPLELRAQVVDSLILSFGEKNRLLRYQVGTAWSADWSGLAWDNLSK